MMVKPYLSQDLHPVVVQVLRVQVELPVYQVQMVLVVLTELQVHRGLMELRVQVVKGVLQELVV